MVIDGDIVKSKKEIEFVRAKEDEHIISVELIEKSKKVEEKEVETVVEEKPKKTKKTKLESTAEVDEGEPVKKKEKKSKSVEVEQEEVEEPKKSIIDKLLLDPMYEIPESDIVGGESI